jgi:hypothetical protein
MSESENDESTLGGADSGHTQRLVRIGLSAVVLVVVVGGVVGLGILPPDGDTDTAGTATPTPVPTLSPPPTDGETATPGIESEPPQEPDETERATATTAPGVTVRGDTRQFQFEVLDLESCGRTCRDANVELTNSGDAAIDVAATSRLYAGKAGDDKVWEGTEAIGDMDAGETVQRTIRIELNFVEASKLCGANTVTLVTVVASTDHRQQFTSHPDVEC